MGMDATVMEHITSHHTLQVLTLIGCFLRIVAGCHGPNQGQPLSPQWDPHGGIIWPSPSSPSALPILGCIQASLHTCTNHQLPFRLHSSIWACSRGKPQLLLVLPHDARINKNALKKENEDQLVPKVSARVWNSILVWVA